MTRFCGKKTGFNPKGSNDTNPNPMGPPATEFMGRGAVPDGKLKNYPGVVADTSMGNRRLSKSNHGDGGAGSTSFQTSTAFGSGERGMKMPKTKTMSGRGAMKMNKK